MMLICKWLSTVIARSDLRLVCVDEDSGMAERPTSTITDDCPAVSPFDCLVVHEFDGSMGSRLQIKVRLLKQGTSHCFRPGLLTPRPDFAAVGSLLDLGVFLHYGGRGRLGRHGRFESLSRDSEPSSRDPQLAGHASRRLHPGHGYHCWAFCR